MHDRDRRREQTCQRIVDVAVEVFAAKGFRAAATRDIAARAKVSQGLITYHFGSKNELWKAAMDRIFEELRTALRTALATDALADPVERLRDVIARYVRFVAGHPELFRVMVEEGKRADARMRWLVDTHLAPLYAGFERLLVSAGRPQGRHHPAHAYYAIAGAASLMFAVAPECLRLTGLDPRSPDVIATHAALLAELLVPRAPSAS
jgi:TetR/AcrR family transcriptional regulator